ncbi:hypothetical protein C0992_002947 [Termitomyces sp. T32_za158]|nr:hypothetical protein C0992_002947 [Termitomyces sp. T32_za158]
MADQSYGPFWDKLFEDWEAKYPECVNLFSNLPSSHDISEEQGDKLKEAIMSCYRQLVSWYRWRTQKKARKAEKGGTKQFQKIIGGFRERLPQVTEIYSDMYYKERIAPHIEIPKGASSTDRLLIIKQVTHELWNAETNAVKERVHARLVKLKHEKDEKKNRPLETPSAEQIVE